ncbi:MULTISPECIES: flagellar biosynthesis anti-sigma factor FlgM [Pseudoalteromonas]|uniref:Negative regulator of flagellin synthesis n=2 Tax=Pseudoalteromonas TaxID=53246 RepID=A0A0F4PC45_PSEO7|nr:MULTISPECIES: flagellar biosynthesis anti-sigma factor FlgM [Pseudoalteromonas]ASD67522.1 flagellar biosynthesis anti-sigma factor FlgM [Pseudoalteromonas piscicida]ATD05778.1 negative regulator of flagellin synthesis FlgM [Pseudoalteromonas piscicida]AUJ69447.1 Anti-sigma-28 factor, FlgM [Pseudoalteromonas sp. NC201]AXQ98494.1 flagellar biosynthesis anti-sigma factor FlgM [Pseudoalteromonas piscicida]AXR01777.1 flagellar biosynthesis anti-sigma factor FlgM [Pseudoalteromonas piscicida]
MVNQVNGQNQSTSVANNVKQQKAELQRNDANSASVKSPATPKAAADSVSLTPQAQQLKTVNEKAQQSSGFDDKKVEELKKAIAEGKYQVDAEKLAKNIAAFEFEIYG